MTNVSQLVMTDPVPLWQVPAVGFESPAAGAFRAGVLIFRNRDQLSVGIFRSVIRHLAQADRHIVDLKAHIVRQRVILKHALDTGQPSDLAESLLQALEESLSIFEKHRKLILEQMRRPVREHPSAPTRQTNSGPGLATTPTAPERSP